MNKPAGWKNYEDFAAGIDTNRIPGTDALAGQTLVIDDAAGNRLELRLGAKNRMAWSDWDGGGQGWFEAVPVAPATYFLDLTFRERPRDALTLVVNTRTLRTLSVLSRVRAERIEGEPQVVQTFNPGILAAPGKLSGMEPAPSRDLIGKRTWQRYSPHHLYEHTYLSSERYCWQCLQGEQCGHGDVDLATTYKFDEHLYVFTFREFKIPVASVFCFNFDSMRSTGKFLGIKGNGAIENTAAGAFITLASETVYEQGCEPV